MERAGRGSSDAGHAGLALGGPPWWACCSSTDGEPYQEIVDNFIISGAIPEAEAIADLLLELPGALPISSDETLELGFTREGNATYKSWRRTFVGIAKLGGALALETNSVARADRLRAMVEAKLGPRIRHESRTVAAQKTCLSINPIELRLDAQPVTQWLKPSAELLQAEFLTGWQHQPSEALDGLTPREAAKRAKTRGKLHEILSEMEYDAGDQSISRIMARLRAELGIDAAGEPLGAPVKERAVGMGRKASETLLEFALPLLLDVEDSALGEAVIRTAAEVWNHVQLPVTTLAAIVLVTLEREGLEGLELEPAEVVDWIEFLLPRRLEREEDKRIFRISEVRRGDPEFYIVVESRVIPANLGMSKNELRMLSRQ